jgi:hypothetical protein
MGRQIRVIMNELDELNFIDFLRAKSEIEIYTLHAETIENLSHPSLPKDRNIVQFYIWNKTFPWIPSIGQSTINTPYITNISTAPVIEYMREKNKQSGRIYWAKVHDNAGKFTHNFSTYSYDIESFEIWYEEIIKWIKKNSIAKGKKNDKTYYLENAWKSRSWISSMFHNYF